MIHGLTLNSCFTKLFDSVIFFSCQTFSTVKLAKGVPFYLVKLHRLVAISRLNDFQKVDMTLAESVAADDIII